MELNSNIYLKENFGEKRKNRLVNQAYTVYKFLFFLTKHKSRIIGMREFLKIGKT